MTEVAETRAHFDRLLSENNGLLRLEPAWVARDWLPPGRRLGLEPSDYDVGERGFICERWLGSTTLADNRIGPNDEGLSYVLFDDGTRLQLREAIRLAGKDVLGPVDAGDGTIGRLAKIFDYGARIPFHIHPRLEHARLVGRNPKEEAYYFPHGAEMGPHPETFFGVHPSIAESSEHDILVPYLVDWDSDLILRHSRAFLQVPGDGFHVPAGILHAPGTALTLELQEESDSMAMLQALNAGTIISKELFYRDIAPARRHALEERAILEWIDWEANGDPHFYEHRHLTHAVVKDTEQPDGFEQWIFGGSTKFSGKRTLVRPGGTFTSLDRGAYTLLAWRGRGAVNGVEVVGGKPGRDELMVCFEPATQPVSITNTGNDDLELFKFFGPGVNDPLTRKL